MLRVCLIDGLFGIRVLAMHPVLLLSVAAVLGVCSGHGPHAGNFMASSPCFSFQGQNILWPSGPQGVSGVNSPFGWLSHPFFAKGCGPAASAPIAGAPIEASLANSPDESAPSHAVQGGPVPPAIHADTPANAPVVADIHDHNSVSPIAPPTPLLAPALPPVVSPDAAPVLASAPVVDATHAVVAPEIDSLKPVNVATQPIPVATGDNHVADSINEVNKASEIAPAVPLPTSSTVVPVEPPTVVGHDLSTAASTNTDVKVDEPKIDVKDNVQVDNTPAPNAVDITTAPPLIDACNMTSLHPPTNGHDDSFPSFDLANFTDLCNLTQHNLTDIDSISCQNPWYGCGSPEIPHVYDNHFHPLDCGFHNIHSNEVPHHPDVYGGIHHYPIGCNCFSDPGYDTEILPPVSALNATDFGHLNLTDFQSGLPSDAKIVTDPADLNCARHRIVHEVKPVVDECITCFPYIRNKIKQKEETFTHHIPIVTDHVSTCEEKRVCHIPIVNQHAHSVVEHQHDHIPLTQSRLVPLVQPYVDHVPITRPYIRPIVETSTSHVPVVESCVRPVVHHSVHTVPITERRCRPVIEEAEVNGPYYNYEAPNQYHGETISNEGCAERYNYPNIRNLETEGFDHLAAGSSAVPSVDFRRNLYLPSENINRHADCFGPYEEASLPSSPSEYNDGRGSIQEQGGFEEKQIREEPLDQEVRGGSRSPLAYDIPFPHGKNQFESDQTSCYSNHPDYCQ